MRCTKHTLVTYVYHQSTKMEYHFVPENFKAMTLPIPTTALRRVHFSDSVSYAAACDYGVHLHIENSAPPMDNDHWHFFVISGYYEFVDRFSRHIMTMLFRCEPPEVTHMLGNELIASLNHHEVVPQERSLDTWFE